jgi:hypothetical protein
MGGPMISHFPYRISQFAPARDLAGWTLVTGSSGSTAVPIMPGYP